ncbi:IST1 protein [Trichuris trichiura]|uniref:IST1 homolog n=1 Tax=Trichuris trichiura TaxID=36087 RepID=A0A077ZMN9_TRITR|nr:IST1 protein [Trichuris trichiura]
MFSVGPNYTKLKTNLRLAVNRLKLLEKRKTEQAQKLRKEIAESISQGKEDRARIRVEHIIREDYSVEALELIEMLCELLLARFDLIQMLDDGLEEAVNSILWAAPRISTEVPELRVISDQLAIKYGRMFVDACRENRFAKVNTKLLQKLSIQTPSKVLVEKYMIEIAQCHGVEFKPNMKVLKEDDFAAAEALLIDFQNKNASANTFGSAYSGDFGSNPAEEVVSRRAPELPEKDADNTPATASGPYDGLFDLPDPPAYDALPTGGAPIVSTNTASTQTDTNMVDGNTQATNASNQYEVLDYDDLFRRFEELKKRH